MNLLSVGASYRTADVATLERLAIADHAYVVAQGRVVRDGPSRLIARDPEVMETFLGKKKAA